MLLPTHKELHCTVDTVTIEQVQVTLLHYSTYKEHSIKRGCPIQEGIMWEGFTVVVTLGLQEAMEGRHFSAGTFEILARR